MTEMSRLKYSPPFKKPKVKMSRRVYLLPDDLVMRIFAIGKAEGHETEVSVVRSLLEDAVKRKGY